jgi:type II secretory pathway pseudopilin PulG
VVVIIGILSVLSIAYFSNVKENVADREAKANLKNIQVGEKSYLSDHSSYYPAAGTPVSDIGNINTNLKLSLPTDANRNWNYQVDINGCAQAIRVNGTRSWFLTMADADGQPDAGACP